MKKGSTILLRILLGVFIALSAETVLKESAFAQKTDAAAIRYFHLGTEYLKTRQFSQAINEFNRALVLEPNRVEFLYNLGLSYQGAKKKNEAEKLLKRLFLVSNVDVFWLIRTSWKHKQMIF